MHRIREFIKEWQDGLLWLPIALALLLGATWLLQWLDPRAGVDGLGFLQGYAALAFKGVLLTFMAWLGKRTYTRDASEGEELTLATRASLGNWQPLLIDRAEWLMWLGLWYLVLSG